MYIYIFTYMYIYVYTRVTCLRIHKHLSVYIPIYTYIHMYNIHMYVCMRTSTHTCVHTFICQRRVRLRYVHCKEHVFAGEPAPDIDMTAPAVDITGNFLRSTAPPAPTKILPDSKLDVLVAPGCLRAFATKVKVTANCAQGLLDMVGPMASNMCS